MNTAPADAPVKSKERLGLFLTTIHLATRCGKDRCTLGTLEHAIVSTTCITHERSSHCQ